MNRLSVGILAPLLIVACPDDTVVPDESSSSDGETTSSETPTTAGDATTSEPPDSTTSDTTSGETSTTGGETSTNDTTGPVAPPVCGNGIVEGDEPCDDSNDEPDDGCNKLCERTGVPLWTVSWDAGIKQDDYASSVRVDPDGNIYVGGTIEQDDSISDAVVRKLDKDGKELLQFTYAGELGLDDGTRGIALTDDGGVIAVGYERLNDMSAQQGWVRRFDAEGATDWTFTYPSTFPDGLSLFHAVAVDGDAVYVFGADEIEDNIYQSVLMRLGPNDGMPVWTTKLTEGDSFSLQDVTVGPDGDVYIATAVAGMTDTKPAVGRYTPDGDEVWLKGFPGVGFARGLAVNQDGDIAAIGYVLGELGDYDLWISRITADGDQVWSDKYDRGGKFDLGASVAWSAAGDIYGVGVAIDKTLDDVFVRRWTGDGETYWTSFYNDPIDLYDSASSVAVTDEKIVVVGSENVSGSGANQWIRAYQP